MFFQWFFFCFFYVTFWFNKNYANMLSCNYSNINMGHFSTWDVTRGGGSAWRSDRYFFLCRGGYDMAFVVKNVILVPIVFFLYFFSEGYPLVTPLKGEGYFFLIAKGVWNDNCCRNLWFYLQLFSFYSFYCSIWGIIFAS